MGWDLAFLFNIHGLFSRTNCLGFAENWNDNYRQVWGDSKLFPHMQAQTLLTMHSRCKGDLAAMAKVGIAFITVDDTFHSYQHFHESATITGNMTQQPGDNHMTYGTASSFWPEASTLRFAITRDIKASMAICALQQDCLKNRVCVNGLLHKGQKT